MNGHTLTIVGSAAAFSFVPGPHVAAAELDGRLLLAAHDPAAGTVALSILARGGKLLARRSLPLASLADLVACGGAAFCLGARGPELRLLRLDDLGVVLSEDACPFDPALLIAPRLVCAAGAPSALWVDGAGRLVARSAGRSTAAAVDGDTRDLAAAALLDGLALLRLVGLPGHLELARYDEGGLGPAQVIAESEPSYSPQLVPLADRLAALWVGPGAIRGQLFAADLSPLGPPRTLLALPAAQRVRWLRATPSRHATFAIVWQAEVLDGRPDDTPDDAQLTTAAAPVDAAWLAAGAPVQLPLAGPGAAAAGWVGDELFVALGGSQSLVILRRD